MRMLPLLRVLKREDGQDLIELALVLPLLLLILVLVVDLGRAFNTQMVLVNAAREGARQAARDTFNVQAVTEAALHETRNAGLADDAVSVAVSSASSGNPVQVTVQYDFSLISGILPFGSIPLSSAVSMVVF